MEGNLERAFMNAAEKMDSRASAEAEKRTSMQDWSVGLKSAAMMAGGAALV